MPLPPQGGLLQNNVEPMVIDMAVEENDNTEEEPVIIESTSLDLEAYASSYTGLPKLYRLMFVAERCPQLRIEALRMAINYSQTTYNVNMYTNLHRKLQEALNSAAGYGGGNLPDVAGGALGNAPVGLPTLDMQWVESRAKKAALKLEKLDADLKNSKGNSIKESIRRGHDGLGDHYLDCGDLSKALKCYSSGRDYCTSFKQIVNMCCNVIKVSVFLNNWNHVLNYVGKAQTSTDINNERAGSSKDLTTTTQTNLTCAAGLAFLATRKYKSAAKNFLAAQLDGVEYLDLLSPSNIAMYGGLCALATFSRSALQKQVISNSHFKVFLELEPQLRDIIIKFYESKYASCLKLLDELKDLLLLDMYLAPHVNTLYNRIRNRALVQYFTPYTSADLDLMAKAFNTTVPALEDEVMALILDGQIQARIDSHNKILYAKDVEERSATFEKSLALGREHVQQAKSLILRSALIKNKIYVESPPREFKGNNAAGDSTQSCADMGLSASYSGSSSLSRN